MASQQPSSGGRTTGRKDTELHYDATDLEALLLRRGPFNSWDEAIGWLKEYGEADNEFTPGEVQAMIADLERLKKEKKPFVRDPNVVYRMARGEG